MARSLHLAIVQRGPVYFDLPASTDLAIKLIQEANDKGAKLIVFGETWLSGYPAWLDHSHDYARWDDARTKEVFTAMHANSVVISGAEIKSLCDISNQLDVCICIGVNEKETTTSGTIYNSVLIIDQGDVKLHHRKLMPTYTEKLVYGIGDGGGLHAVDTSVGRIGALICWEHWMPLTRQALHNSGEEIHIALWPNVHEMLQVASRHYAFEGRCVVLSVGQLLHGSQMPEQLDTPRDKWLLKGGSSVIGPSGHYLLQPQYDAPDIIYHTIEDLDKIYGEKMTLDVSGHYQRPDIFRFEVDQGK